MYGDRRVQKFILTFSPDWPVIGLLLVFIGFFVDFEVHVVRPREYKKLKK